jgi:hypothetical protein
VKSLVESARFIVDPGKNIVAFGQPFDGLTVYKIYCVKDMAITFSQVVKSYTNVRQQKELYKVLHAEGLFTGLKTATNEYYRLSEGVTQNEKLQCFEKMLMEVITLTS